MKVTVICENSVMLPLPRGLIAEHGLAMLLEGDKNILYDTGHGTGLLNNLPILGKDVSGFDAVVISHGHYDHAGGLPGLLEKKGPTEIWIHPDAFIEKIAYIELGPEKLEIPIGMADRAALEKGGARISECRGYREIAPGIHALTEVKRPAGWKTWDVRLKRKVNGAVEDDPFDDDMSLLIDTDSGPVVVLGCAHAGIVEILDDLSERSGHRSFHAVIGGTHLGTAPAEYVERALASLERYDVKIIATSHCTGFEGACAVASRFGDRFRNASVGSVFQF